MSYDSEASTRAHMVQVAARLNKVCEQLRLRGERHDASKLSEIEKPYYDAVIPKLKNLVYGSKAYREAVKELGPALKSHFASNSHHPEHYKNGCAVDAASSPEPILIFHEREQESSEGGMPTGRPRNGGRRED